MTKAEVIHKSRSVRRNCFAFRKNGNDGYYVEDFAKILKEYFHAG